MRRYSAFPMKSGTVSSCKHVTIDDLLAAQEFSHLTEAEATQLLKQIEEFSNLILNFTQKQDNE